MLNLITGQVSHQSEPGECNMPQDYCPQSKSTKNENDFFFFWLKQGSLNILLGVNIFLNYIQDQLIVNFVCLLAH